MGMSALMLQIDIVLKCPVIPEMITLEAYNE